jgi:hypothetical protein
MKRGFQTSNPNFHAMSLDLHAGGAENARAPLSKKIQWGTGDVVIK